MDQAAVEAFTDEVKKRMLDDFGASPDRTVDLGGFESFIFLRHDTNTILRATHRSHRGIADIEAELDWIAHLAANGARVCTPIARAAGELAIAVDAFTICEFERARGRPITEAEWTPALFTEWGRCIGEFHRLTRDFEPAGHRRVHWKQDPNFDFAARLPADETKLHEHAARHLAAFTSLPETDDTFGLIHCDAHAGNYFYDEGTLTFFDFDDACYCWFGYDVATILFGAILQPWIGDTSAARVEAAQAFLPSFLEGYARESDVGGLMLESMPLFLKIRELGLYGVIKTFLADVDDNWYANKFMAGRRELLEQDAPFLEADFTGF